MTDPQVVYIIGVGRSGTSLLMTLLNAHSQIAFTPETHFLRFYLGNEAIKTKMEAQGVEAFQQLLEADDYFKRLNFSTTDLLQPYLNKGKPFQLDQVYKDLLQRYLNGKGKQLIGDKDPRYIDYLDMIHYIFPTAKIIHIYRDPRDVMLSKTKAEWSAHRPIWLNAAISQIQIERGRTKAQQLFQQNYYELAYESLLTQPNETLTQLLIFLGLAFEEKMFDLQKSASELVDISEMQWKDNTFRPLKGDNIEKWRTQLTPMQIRTIEIICKTWFQHLGYEPSDQKIGFFKELGLRLAFSFRGLQRLFYNYKLRGQMKQQLTVTNS